MKKVIALVAVVLAALMVVGVASAKKPVHNAGTAASATVTQTGTTACYDNSATQPGQVGNLTTCPVYAVTFTGLTPNTTYNILFSTPIGTGILAGEETSDANGVLVLGNILAPYPSVGTYTYSAATGTTQSTVVASVTWTVS